MKRDIAINGKLIDSLADYDLLVVAGGGVDAVNKQASKLDGPFMRLIQKYTELRPSSEQFPRILL